LIGYFGGCNVGLKGSPFRSEQQKVSSPDLSNPQNLGGDELLKSEKLFLTHNTLCYNGKNKQNKTALVLRRNISASK
jgi:hypothetical protein